MKLAIIQFKVNRTNGFCMAQWHGVLDIDAYVYAEHISLLPKGSLCWRVADKIQDKDGNVRIT